MSENGYPPGWDEARVQRVLDHYENQTDDEAVAEDEDMLDVDTRTVMEVPSDLVDAIRELIAKRRAG
jgi:hypothetical protein